MPEIDTSELSLADHIRITFVMDRLRGLSACQAALHVGQIFGVPSARVLRECQDIVVRGIGTTHPNEGNLEWR